MACGCGLNGSMIIDMGSSAERRSNPQRRQGLSAVFSIEVLEMRGSTPLDITIMHKNDDETAYTSAGSFSSITTLGVHTKYLSGIKQKYYSSLKVQSASGDPDGVVVGSLFAQFFP